MTQSENILIVDDELPIRQLMTRIVTDDGYRCQSAGSAAEALALMGKQPFSLLLTDIKMPEMDGLELIEKVKQDYPEVGVLVMTGVGDREVALKALELGAFGYMLKPCEPFEVQVHLAAAARLARLEKLNRSYQQQLENDVAARTAELEEINRQLRQQEKLAAIGQLAAGLAHEIKIPNGYVATNLISLKKYLERLVEYVGRLQAALPQVASDDVRDELQALGRKLKIDLILEDTEELIDNCQDGTKRIKKIIQGLKDFSAKDAEDKLPLDLNTVIEESLTLVWNELKYKVEVELDLGELLPIVGFHNRLSQVFINLLVNAAQAIETKGVIRISSQVEGGQVVARVADTGGGIAAENLGKVFEAFFTTKEIGVGTGLGLSIVKDIVDEHQGSIEVVSPGGEGATFTLRFPLAENK